MSGSLGSLRDRVRWGDASGPEAFDRLLRAIRDGSPFLADLLDADPDRVSRFAEASPEESLAALVAGQRTLETQVRETQESREEAGRRLRRARKDHALLVALADLGGVWALDEVTAALTGFADGSVAVATAAALRAAVEGRQLGDIALSADGEGSGLAVLALGKHGAGELNYSSDIDLIVLYDPTAPAILDRDRAARTYMRIAQDIAKLLSERNAEGYVHRVDYRLRPDPGSTPVAVSLPAAYAYYETVGQNWERAAMIKARPVGGDLSLGTQFLRNLRPFIWRKYFDFNAIADIHAMKRQIHAVRGHGSIAVEGHDIKLGRGGIREIEFFVQTQQLVFGGRRTELRGQRTLDMLAELERQGWVTATARDELSDAYRFLRTIEHRLQMVADEQTQRLPAERTELATFARFAGFDGRASFAKALMAHASRVERHYALLFEGAPELVSELGNLVFTGTEDDPATLETLRRLGFRDAPRVAETIRGWHHGRRAAVTSPRAREVLTELVPLLLKALGGTSDPDGGLAYLDEAFARMPAAVELLGILRQHERLRVLFADLLGSAPRLADEVSRRPHVLDPILDPSFARPVRDEEGIEGEFLALLGSPATMEDFLDHVRDAAHQLQFLTGARLLSGIFAPQEAGFVLAAIARAAIRAVLDRVVAEFAVEHGHVPGAEVVVLGLGRLGAANLTSTSDLDLVVLYDFDHERRTSDGPRPLDAVVYHLRLTQRLVAALSVPTRRGRLFEIDLRLRPSGSKGPLATQFERFRAYYDEEGELWERMALTRARLLAGSPGLAARTEETIDAVVRARKDGRAVYRGVHDMRMLVAREKKDGGDLDLKLAPGGLLDLDFLAQALVLAHSADVPSLVGAPTPTVLVEAARHGVIGESEGRTLADAYRSLDDVLHWQRLTLGDDPGQDTDNTPTMRKLASLSGAPDPTVLGAHLADMRRPIRDLFDRILTGT